MTDSIIEHWRRLLYPLGFLTTAVFAGRFLVQWLNSEIKQKSIVNRSFWWLSLTGNLLFVLHSLIQMQFHVCVVQACNSVIAWRNLNLMHAGSKPNSPPIKFSTVIWIFIFAISLVIFAFLLETFLLGNSGKNWFRAPAFTKETDPTLEISPFWHLVGFIALALFSGRFWVQWWYAEKQQTSHLGPAFWWLSLIGGALTIIYFVSIGDPVNVVGPALGLIPYARNLMLIYKVKKSAQNP